LKSVGEQAFSCSGIAEVRIPARVEVLEKSAFARCKALRRVRFKEGSMLRVVGEYAFYLSGLEKIELPESVKSIGKASFARCAALASVEGVAGEGVKIAEDAFADCPGLAGGGGIESCMWGEGDRRKTLVIVV
jgi:hypothetical protein